MALIKNKAPAKEATPTKAVTPPTTAKPVKAVKAVKAVEPKPEPKEEAVEVIRLGRKQLSERIRELVMSTGVAISPKVAEVAVVAYEEAVTEFLSQGAVIALPGFGTFSAVDRGETIRPNPQKPGETVTVPAHKAPKFKAGANLKKALNTDGVVEEEAE